MTGQELHTWNPEATKLFYLHIYIILSIYFCVKFWHGGCNRTPNLVYRLFFINIHTSLSFTSSYCSWGHTKLNIGLRRCLSIRQKINEYFHKYFVTFFPSFCRNAYIQWHLTVQVRGSDNFCFPTWMRSWVFKEMFITY